MPIYGYFYARATHIRVFLMPNDVPVLVLNQPHLPGCSSLFNFLVEPSKPTRVSYTYAVDTMQLEGCQALLTHLLLNMVILVSIFMREE